MSFPFLQLPLLRSVYCEGGAEPIIHIPLAQKMAALKALQRPAKGVWTPFGRPHYFTFSICIAGSPPARDIPLDVALVEKLKFKMRGVYTERK
jgi:hypothetical protein